MYFLCILLNIITNSNPIPHFVLLTAKYIFKNQFTSICYSPIPHSYT